MAVDTATHPSRTGSGRRVPGGPGRRGRVQVRAAFALAPALVVALAAPVAGQLPFTVVAEPGSHEAVKKRALWTNCLGVSLSTRVTSDTDLSEESVWNAAEAALRSARIYYDDPQNPEFHSRWLVMVRVWGGASTHYVAIEFLDTGAGSVVADWTLEQLADDDGVVPGDLDFLAGWYTVMTYRVHALGSGRGSPADLLGRVRTQMDTFLVDYLRAHANCAEGSL